VDCGILRIILFQRKREVLVRNNRLLSSDATRTVYKKKPPTILLCHGNVFTEPLPRDDRGTHSPVEKITAGLPCTVILGSESHGTHDHILLSDGSGSLQATASAVDILKLGTHNRPTDSHLIR
jgi:hypothetical protein